MTLDDLRLPVDIERLLVTYLAGDPHVTAITHVIGTAFDWERGFPALRLSRVGGSAVTNVPLWIDQPRVQFDAYGTTNGEASTLGRTVKAVLQNVIGTHPEGVVTDVVYGIDIDLPDGEFDPPQPRFVFDTLITTHPTP
jgi:hypothetical protein